MLVEQEEVKGSETTLVCLFTYLAGLPYHGSPLIFPTGSQPTNPSPTPRSIDIDIGWPTSLVGGERPVCSKFVWGTKKNDMG